MFHQQIHPPVIDDESISWVPLVPSINDLLSKYLRADPIGGDHVLAIDWHSAAPRDTTAFD